MQLCMWTNFVHFSTLLQLGWTAGMHAVHVQSDVHLSHDLLNNRQAIRNCQSLLTSTHLFLMSIHLLLTLALLLLHSLCHISLLTHHHNWAQGMMYAGQTQTQAPNKTIGNTSLPHSKLTLSTPNVEQHLYFTLDQPALETNNAHCHHTLYIMGSR